MRVRAVLVATIILVCASALWAASCIDAVLGQISQEIRAGKSTQQDLDALIAYAKNIDSSSDVGKGLVSAISSRAAQKDGANRAAQIINNFPGSQDSIFSSLEPFKNKKGFSDLVVGLGNPNQDTAFGSSEELRFALNKLGPANVDAFQVSDLTGVEPDLRDVPGNLYEIKAHNYTGQPDFLVAQDLGKIHDQAATAIAQLPTGNTLTVAFSFPLTPAAENLYQKIFADLIANPNFIRINGF
jgi:hypothetical protein